MEAAGALSKPVDAAAVRKVPTGTVAVAHVQPRQLEQLARRAGRAAVWTGAPLRDDVTHHALHGSTHAQAAGAAGAGTCGLCAAASGEWRY